VGYIYIYIYICIHIYNILNNHARTCTNAVIIACLRASALSLALSRSFCALSHACAHFLYFEHTQSDADAAADANANVNLDADTDRNRQTLTGVETDKDR